jgi:hypothetical protein
VCSTPRSSPGAGQSSSSSSSSPPAGASAAGGVGGTSLPGSAPGWPAAGAGALPSRSGSGEVSLPAFWGAPLAADAGVALELLVGGAAIGLGTAGARMTGAAGAGARGPVEAGGSSPAELEPPPPAAQPSARAGNASVAKNHCLPIEYRTKLIFKVSSRLTRLTALGVLLASPAPPNPLSHGSRWALGAGTSVVAAPRLRAGEFREQCAISFGCTSLLAGTIARNAARTDCSRWAFHAKPARSQPES